MGPDHDCTRTCTLRYLLALGAVSENDTLTLNLVISRFVLERSWGSVPVLIMDCCCCCCLPVGRFGLMYHLANVHWLRDIFYFCHSHGKGPADRRFSLTPP